MSNVLVEFLDDHLEKNKKNIKEQIVQEEVLTEELLTEEEYKFGVKTLTESFVSGQIDEASFGKGLKALGRMAKGAAGKAAGVAKDAGKAAAGKVSDTAKDVADKVVDTAKGAGGKLADIAAKGMDSYKSHIADMDDEEAKAEIAELSKEFENQSELRFKNLDKTVNQMSAKVNDAYEKAKAEKDGLEELVIRKKAAMYREFAKDQSQYKELIQTLVGSINGDSNVDFYKRELSDEEKSIIDIASELPKKEVSGDTPTSNKLRSTKAKSNINNTAKLP